MRIKAIRGHFANGKQVAVGEVYEIADGVARDLIAWGKAVAAAAPRSKGPMTSKSAGALIQGGGTTDAQ